MPVNVLLVDDSAVIRGLMTKALAADPAIVIAGSAANGAMAISMARNLKPDVVILDIEMPVMDGITALPELLLASPHSRVIMASTLTARNAAISIEALAKGATDYIAKPSVKFGNDVDAFYRELIAKVKALGGDKPFEPAAAPKPVAQNMPLSLSGTKALAIASSTGGPQALLAVFTALAGHLLNIPIFITQHMPPNFTTILAEHISKVSGRHCIEVKGGEVVAPGTIYLAPGDYHMVPEKLADGSVVVRVNQDAPENYCRPSADPMLRGLSKIYGSKLVLCVLTGMGSDGMPGAKIVVANGGNVIAQNEETCVVYGMPKAVVENNLCRAVLPLPDIARYLISQIEGR